MAGHESGVTMALWEEGPGQAGDELARPTGQGQRGGHAGRAGSQGGK